MRKNSKWMQIYNKICEGLSTKRISYLAIAFFVLMLLPIAYLSFVNRATGDDFSYGVYTREAYLASHSLVQVFKAALRTIRQYYYGWQGTWFSIFVFSMQPEVFSQKAYVIVAFLMTFLWCGSTFLLFRELLVKRLQVEKWSYRIITIIFLTVSIQFIPSTRSAIFWFNGCAHYMLPFAMCQLLVCQLLKFKDTYCSRYLISICILMTLLGGSNYQAALFALIAAFYTGAADFFQKKNKKISILFLPIVLELIGLIISMKAPGNKARGGEEFGLSFTKAVWTIGASFVEGFRDILLYITEKPLAFVGLFLLFLFLLEAAAKRKETGKIPYPVLSVFALICLYSAMQAPALYADVDVSGGVYNMNYQVFLLMMGGILLILAEAIVKYSRQKGKENLQKTYHMIVIGGMVFGMVLLLIFRSDVKESTFYQSVEYIRTGQAADYKEQMELQTKLLMDENIQDVVVPFINDVQGPLMHMPITEDKEAWTSRIAGEFYHKKSVVAMPRPEWEEKYGSNN